MGPGPGHLQLIGGTENEGRLQENGALRWQLNIVDNTVSLYQAMQEEDWCKMLREHIMLLRTLLIDRLPG